MADWDFENWGAVCKDCGRYQAEIRELKEKQGKVQALLTEKNQFVEDAKNFRQLLVNTDGVYKSLSKVVAAKQRIKDRNALYQERQKLMLSVMSRLTVLIFSSLHYIKLWEDEHKVAQRAIDVTVEQRKQLLEKDVKLLGNEQLLKQYVALVAEQAKKMKLTEDLEKEITNLKNEIRKQSRHHQRTLQRAVSAFLEIMSYYHQNRKLSRKQITWLGLCEKSMVGKNIQESVRYNPVFKTDGPTENADLGGKDDGDTNDDADESCVSASARRSTFQDVAVGTSDYALSRDVCVDTEDLTTEACGVAERAGITITSGADDGCFEKSPDSGIQIPQSPLSQTSDYSNSSVESCPNSHHSTTVPSSPPLEDGYMSDPQTTPYVDWSIKDHDYHIRYDDSHVKPREESSNQSTHPHCVEFTKGVDAARTSTPEEMEVLGSDSIAPDVGGSPAEKQLKNLFREVGEAPPKCYQGRKKVLTPVMTSTEAVTRINKQKADIPVVEETCIDKQNTRTRVDKGTRSGNRRVSPLKENQIDVEQQKAKSLEAIIFGESDDEVAEAGLEKKRGELDEGEGGEVPRPTGTPTQDLAEGTGGELTVPRKEQAAVCEDDTMAPSGRNVKSIFDEPCEDEEKSAGKEVARARGDGVCVDKQQASAEQDLFGDTDEDDGWEAADDQPESMPEGGERTCGGEDKKILADGGVFELAADRDACVEKEDSMVLEDRTGVSLTSAVGQNVSADASEGEAIGAGKLPAKTPKEGKLGSEQLQSLTDCFGDAGKDDKVRSVGNTTSSDSKGIGKSDQLIRAGERELVKDSGEDMQQHVSEKLPSRIGEVAEDEGTCITKQQVGNEERARSEDGQKVGENILSRVDNQLRRQREDTKSPDISRMIAEFTQFFLLSPMSPDVVDEENGGDKKDCERTEGNDAGTSELTTVTTVAVVNVQQFESKSLVDNDNSPGRCAIEITDVDGEAAIEKPEEAKETSEHDRSDLISEKENETETRSSTEICRVRRKSTRNYNQHKIINLIENNTVSKITNNLKGCLDTYFTKIMEESVRKRDFEEFIKKEFTPFKETIIETLEVIKLN